MFNLFKKMPEPEFEISGIGIFHQLKHPGHVFWGKNMDLFSINQNVYLTINTFNNADPSPEQVLSIQELPKQYDAIVELVFGYLMKGDESSDLTIENFKQLYFLIEIELNADTKWTYTFEPHFSVECAYSYFMVFEVKDGEIVDYYET